MSHIKVYHGSYIDIPNPKILPALRPLDFGVGFYTTTLESQAKIWAKRLAHRKNTQPVISEYLFDEKEAMIGCSYKKFKSTCDSWLDLIITHRSISAYTSQGFGQVDIHHSYDIVYGEMLDDIISTNLNAYIAGVINKQELKRRLVTQNPNNQICFCTELALKYLQYNGSSNIL